MTFSLFGILFMYNTSSVLFKRKRDLYTPDVIRRRHSACTPGVVFCLLLPPWCVLLTDCRILLQV